MPAAHPMDGFASSNATSNHFLGTQQRPWMTASYRPHNMSPINNASFLPTSSLQTATTLSSNDNAVLSPASGAPPPVTHGHSPHDQVVTIEGVGSKRGRPRTRPLNMVTSEAGQQQSLRHRSSNDPAVLQVSGPSVPSTPARQVSSAPQVNIDVLRRPRALAYIPKLDVFEDHLQSQRQEGVFERQRISLLREACHLDDVFYLLLHQIFCSATLDPTRLSKYGFGNEQIKGLDTLKYVLLSNDGLPLDTLVFFANFPAPPQIMQGERYMVAHIKEFLTRFYHGWFALQDACFVRQYPPFSAESMSRLMADSPVLQKILFNSIHRQLGGKDDPSQTVLQLFEQDQNRFRQSGAHVLFDAEIDSQNIQLGKDYLRLQFVNQNSAPVRQTQLGMFPGASTTTPSTMPVNNFTTTGHALSSTAARQVSGPGTAESPTQVWPWGQFPMSQHGTASMPGRVLGPFNAPQPSISRPRGPHVSSALSGGHIEPSLRVLQMNPSPVFPPTVPTPFIPTLGEQPIQTSNPNPDRVALHQLHLRSPNPRKIDRNGSVNADLRLYQYPAFFVVPPQGLGSRFSQFSWQFDVTPEVKGEIAKDLPGGGPKDSDRPVRVFLDGGQLYRLRCVLLPGATTNCNQLASWAVMDTTWPECCFVLMNDEHLELRRKTHHGKDLSLDLTSYVREGINTIKFSILRTPEEQAKKHFAIAVEVVKVAEEGTVKQMVQTIKCEESIATMTHGLNVDSADDDLQVVDSHVSIDVVDPFMATIFKDPVRGVTCAHRECFDLDTFLHTRKARTKDGPTSPDEWKCPICGKDARPQSLVIDGFLKQVRSELEKTGRLETKAILVKADGSWVPKKDIGKETTRAASKPRGMPTDDERQPTRSSSVVIELDD